MSLSPRQVRPELLDDLPPGHPDALRNRRDLRLINFLQGNFAWIAKQLVEHRRTGECIIEPGAGQGDLAYYHARRGLVAKNAPDWTGLDLWPRPQAWPQSWGWKREDLLAFSDYATYPVFVANFILHQFEDDALRQLGAALRQGTRVIVASETLRAKRTRLGFKAIWPLMNHVSRHDGSVSIDGGFQGQELPELLGLSRQEWDTSVTESFLGTYRMLAVRKACGKEPKDS